MGNYLHDNCKIMHTIEAKHIFRNACVCVHIDFPLKIIKGKLRKIIEQNDLIV